MESPSNLIEGKIGGSKFHLSSSQQNEMILLSVVGKPSDGSIVKFKSTLTSQNLSELLGEKMSGEKFPDFLKSCLEEKENHKIEVRFEKGNNEA